MEQEEQIVILNKAAQLSSSIDTVSSKIEIHDELIKGLMFSTTEVEKKANQNNKKFAFTIKKLENDGRNLIIMILFGVILFLFLVIKS